MNDWIKNSIFYQVYPASFYDSNGDGVGDLQGIIEKLDYIKELGVNALWINPFYSSPFMDGGYDISDYYAINEKFGTMSDFEMLVDKCKKFGIRLVIDLVIGHTSNQHPWFLESAKDEKNKYTDWFIWTDNNFNKFADKSIHGLYARDGGYVINYYACQPALNYGFNDKPREKDPNNAYDLGENWKMHYTDERLKPLREEILNVMRFWLNKGIDGFRVDLANSLVKGCIYDSDDDKDIEGLRWLWNILIGTIKKEYPNVAFIAEWVYPSNAVGKCGFDVDYLGHDCPEYNDLFRNEKGTNILPAFERGYNYFSEKGKGSIDAFLKYTQRLYQDVAGKGYFSVPSGYHDIVRLGEKKDADTLKVIFAFLLTYKHVPFIYYGDEIGMTHAWGINKDGGYIRTGARTPMQWTNGKNRGFSETECGLYLPVNGEQMQSVAEQEQNEKSLLNMVKKLISLRKEHAALNADGELTILRSENGGYPLVYERKAGKEAFVIAINPSNENFIVDMYGTEELSFNTQCNNGKVELLGKSFIIFKR